MKTRLVTTRHTSHSKRWAIGTRNAFSSAHVRVDVHLWQDCRNTDLPTMMSGPVHSGHVWFDVEGALFERLPTTANKQNEINSNYCTYVCIYMHLRNIYIRKRRCVSGNLIQISMNTLTSGKHPRFRENCVAPSRWMRSELRSPRLWMQTSGWKSADACAERYWPGRPIK